MHDPFAQFLGVNEPADALTLLGLTLAQCEPVQIEAALRDRLARVYQHPEGRSEQAEQVRHALRQAAESLKQSAMQRRDSTAAADAAPTMPAFANHPVRRAAIAPMFNLTAFDRLVLAVLVGCGGWNAQSRARLIALATAHGVGVQGLVRVVQGLSDYARSGGRIGVQDITAGNPLPPVTAASRPASLAPALLERLTVNLSAELKREDPWPTIKFATIFGLLTLAACILGVRIMFMSGQPAAPAAQPEAPAATAPSATSPANAASSPAADNVDVNPRIATFPKPPTFLGNALPGDALAAAGQFGVLPAQIDELGRKLTVEENPSEAVFRQWAADMETVSAGWQLADASSRAQVEREILDVLRAAGDRPALSDRLLIALTAPPSLSDPLAIWRGVWQVGLLAKVAAAPPDAALPPVVVERARVLLESILPDDGAGSPPPEVVAGQWLESMLPQLIGSLEVDEQAYDYWELWLTAQRNLGRGDRHDAAIIRTIAQLLATNTDLSRPGPSVNVLGRLLNIALESRSPTIKQGMLDMFEAESVSARDLWVLTSLLSMSDAATWFPDHLVVPDGADQRHRWRIRDELAALWPAANIVNARSSSAAAGSALQVDPTLASEWDSQINVLLAQPIGKDSLEVLRQWMAMARLVEAAHALASQDQAHARRVLDSAAAPAASRPAVPPRRIGKPAGSDAAWAVAYQEAGKTTEQRIEQLRLLRNSAGTDLGPIDADLFVREVYRGSPQDVRVAAQEIVAQFTNGPVVSQAMLDQFGDAPATDAISKVVAEFTGQALPGPRSGGWAAAARIALANHLLELLPDGRDEIDAVAGELTDSLTMQAALLRREQSSAVSPRTALEAAQNLVRAWQGRAESVMTSTPTPDTLPGLHRRRATRLRLAEGPMQSAVAHQLATLDLLTYITVAEQPAARATAVELLRSEGDARAHAATVLEQALHVERAIAHLWRLRLGLMKVAEPSIGLDSPGVPASPSTQPSRSVQANAPAAAADWTARLESLNPSAPLAYFELAEEVTDAASDAAQRELGLHLFALAGVLDPEHLGRSACLALADLEPNPQAKRRLLALASLLGSSMSLGAIDSAPAYAAGSSSPASIAAALAMSEAFGHYRRGQGARAQESLRRSGAMEMLQQCDRILPGGAAKFIEDCKFYRGQARPSIAPQDLARMLRVEVALLTGADRTWSADLLLTDSRPLIEVDPARLGETLAVNPAKAYYHNGHWTEAPGTGSSGMRR